MEINIEVKSWSHSSYAKGKVWKLVAVWVCEVTLYLLASLAILDSLSSNITDLNILKFSCLVSMYICFISSKISFSLFK